MPTASPWIKQGAFPSCTRAPSKHSAVLSSLEQMGPIKVFVSSTTSAKYPSTGTKSREKNKPQRGSLLSVLRMCLRHVLRSWPGSVHPPRGWQDALPHPSGKDIVSVPRERQLAELWAASRVAAFGKPVPALPCLLFYMCGSTLHARIQTFRKRLCWKGGQGTSFHKKGNRDRPGRWFFFRKFRAETGLRGHGCPYSAARFLHKTLLSSALQMQVEIFLKCGELLSDLSLFQLHL